MSTRQQLMLYAAVLAGLLLLLKSLEYRYLLRRVDLPVYLTIVGLLCLALGIWLGYQWVSPLRSQVPRPLGTHSSPSIPLSPRETDVLLLLSEGLSNQEIADRLYISIHTVKTHTNHIFEKMGVKRRTQAILRGRELGIIK